MQERLEVRDLIDEHCLGYEGPPKRHAITSAVIKVGNELAVCKNDSRFWQLRDGESMGASSYELLVSHRYELFFGGRIYDRYLNCNRTSYFEGQRRLMHH